MFCIENSSNLKTTILVKAKKIDASRLRCNQIFINSVTKASHPCHTVHPHEILESIMRVLGLCLLFTGISTSFTAYAEEDTMEEQIVVGTRASLMSAINKQEMADSIKSIADSDALGDFPDTTAAEAIRRLSGISIENDQGEGRYVTIRGLSSDLNAIAVNGASIVAPENGRSVLLDGVPTELLDSITVSKSLTPDQDLDSIGGRIDFKTKNPSDLRNSLFKIKLDTQYNEQSDSPNSPRVVVTYGESINDSMSHILGITYSAKQIVTYNNETGFGWDSDGLMDDDWEMRYYDIERQRAGVTYDLDFLQGDSTRYYLSAFWNEYTDDELRWKDEYGKIKAVSALPSGVRSSRVRHHAETRVRSEVRTISAFTLGAETTVSGWSTDAMLSYSYAEENDSDNADVTFENYDKELGGDFFWNRNTKPYVVALDENLRNPADLEFDEAEFEDAISKDSETALSANAEQTFDFGTLKFGAKYRTREKDRDNDKYIYKMDGTLADFNPQTLDWPFANQVFGQQADPGMIYALRDQRSSMELDEAETFVEDFIVAEDIFSIYGMGTFELGNALVVAGVRIENTSVDGEAFDQDGAKVTSSNEHTFVSPSVNIKYGLSDQLLLRGAFWRSLARPGFNSIAPAVEIEVDGDEVSGKVGNPDLEPYEASNFDISLEFYGDGMTYIAAGVFYKDIDNAIYKTIQKTGTFNGVTFTDEVETWLNSDQSTVLGLELNFQYGLENGLFIATNLTHMLDNESTFQNDGDSTFTTPFRKLADDTANVSFGFDKGKLDVRLAMNYRSEYLDSLADGEDDIDKVSGDNSRFTDSHLQWDLTAKYKYNEDLTVKFEAININNRPEFYYWGRKTRLSQYDEYGSSYSLGVIYKL